jgi:hypothetical protein
MQGGTPRGSLKIRQVERLKVAGAVGSPWPIDARGPASARRHATGSKILRNLTIELDHNDLTNYFPLTCG